MSLSLLARRLVERSEKTSIPILLYSQITLFSQTHIITMATMATVLSSPLQAAMNSTAVSNPHLYISRSHPALTRYPKISA